jgi:acetylglutamate kinase
MSAFDDPDAQLLTTAKPFVGRTMVVRVDPAAAASETLVSDLVFMRRIGVRPLIVHDTEPRAAFAPLVGRVNRVGGEAVGLDGTAASTLVVSAAASGRTVVRSVNAQLLELLLDQNYIPIVAAAGARVSGGSAPLDADEAARAVAASLRAIRLLISAQPGGIPSDGAGVISELTSSEALALAKAGTLSPDLAGHLVAAAMGVRAGVDAAQILDLSASHAAVVEMLTAHHVGTQVVSNIIL